MDEWVARGFGSRLQLALWAHVGYAAASWLTFQESAGCLPVWLHYALAISSSDGFAAIAGAVNGLVIIEQTEEDRQRIQIQRINSVFGCCEWLVMACAYFLWDARPTRCGPFRSYLTFVCLLSVATTALAVRGLRRSASDTKPRRRSESLWQRLRPFLRASAGDLLKFFPTVSCLLVCEGSCPVFHLVEVRHRAKAPELLALCPSDSSA